uniref:Velvet domain-containing protein n=1 Tax=Anthurium amnicola TaxID=1678845 RepID=A0A1D1XQ09_9ARAE
MYSQPGAPLHSEYHGAGRGEYPPPPESYYPPPPLPPHIPPPPHHSYYDYHPSHHYVPYHPAAINPNVVPPQAPPSDFGDRTQQRRSKSNTNTPTSTSESSDKNKASTFPKSTTTLHKARFKKERFGTFDSPAGGEEDDKRKYTLRVSQQPLRARMCGFGEKDRRPIDPPPIVQLVVTDEKGNPDTGANLRMLQNPFFRSSCHTLV